MLIDECQDLTQAELSLLLEVAHDKDALYLCGDTAQTISRGVGFRFADVRTLFHAHCERGEAAMPALRSLTTAAKINTLFTKRNWGGQRV